MTKVDSLMELFEGGLLDKKIMEKSGYLNYRTTPWETYKLKLQVRKELENGLFALEECNFRAYVGISWLKSTTFQKRITLNIFENFTGHLKETIHLAEEEILAKWPQGPGT